VKKGRAPVAPPPVAPIRITVGLEGPARARVLCALCGRTTGADSVRHDEKFVCPECARHLGGLMGLASPTVIPDHAAPALRPHVVRRPVQHSVHRPVPKPVRRTRERYVRRLKDRVEEARRVLDSLCAADRTKTVEYGDLVARWRDWDDEEGRRMHDELLDDLAVLYPDADDARLGSIAEALKMRSQREKEVQP